MTNIRINIKSAYRPPLWMHKEDRDTDIFGGGVRSCASQGGCPAVFTLKEPRLKTFITKQWQYYLLAINYNMTLENVALLMHFELAFANGTGVGDDSDPRADFIREQNLFSPLPQFDKDRTCSRNLLTGMKVGDNLLVSTMDGNNPPPLKVGRLQPTAIEDINLDDYLYNPKDHPWMFVVANRVTTKPGNQTSVAPFPRGGMYSWTGNNNLYSFIPLVSREVIEYPLRHLYEIPQGADLPSPYRIVTT
jgi:hypothetical protein